MGAVIGLLKIYYPILIVSLLVLRAGYADSLDGRGQLVTVGVDHITGLKWSSMMPRLKEKPTTAILEGRYERSDWSLVWEDRKVELGPDGGFRLELRVSKAQTDLNLRAVSPLGQTERQQFLVLVRELETKPAEKPTRRFSASGGLGLAAISYRQTGMDLFSEGALTVKASLLYLLRPPVWDLGLTAYATMLPLYSSRQGVTASFLGVNFRAGYALPWFQEPWRATVLFGGYYATTFVKDAAFGYENLFGPQLFPTVRRMVSKSNAAALYFKYSPVTSGFKMLRLSTREVAFGLSWIHLLPKERSFAVTLDAADLNLELEGINVRSKSLSLGLGYTP
jgi:hypothetical protein